MKTITGILSCIGTLLATFQSYTFYAHVNGPNYTCPNSELIYYYDDDYGGAIVEFTITNGLIFNEITETWVNYWSFDRRQHAFGNGFPFRILWNNSPLGTLGGVQVKVCDAVFQFIGRPGIEMLPLALHQELQPFLVVPTS